jgi:ABC-type lipoprotein release transport system permease subunit
VIGFLASALRNRPWRAGTLALGILAAAVAFVLLTGSAATSALRIQGTLKSNYRNAYDILIRPNGSTTPLERQQRLVRPNFLSGIYGGITFKQYHQIEQISGVAVAAPIANVGTVLVEQQVKMSLKRLLGPQTDQLFRVRFSWVAQNGLSHYPASDEYLYATQRLLDLGPLDSMATRDPLTGKPDQVCEGYNVSKPLVHAPFAPVNSSTLRCASPNLTPALKHHTTEGQIVLPPVVELSFELPLNISAIDPEAEAKLVGLRRAMVSGRYLSSSSRPRLAGLWREIPVLAASRSFVDEQLQAQIERLIVPAGTDVPGIVGAGACGSSDVPGGQGCHTFGAIQHPLPKEPGPPGHRHTTAYRWLTSLRGAPIGRRSFDAGRLYAQGLRHLNRFEFPQFQLVHAYWRGAPVRYRRLADRSLEPLPVKNGAAVWQEQTASIATLATGYLPQPTDNRDVQFRTISNTHANLGTVGGANQELDVPALRVVGVFNPKRLRGFSPLSRVPLETYYPPSLEPGNAESRELLHGQPLLPSQNIGDYEQQPPLLLTNLRGLQTLLSAGRFSGVSPRQQHAPISEIRVRVKGVTGTDPLSRLRIRIVAQQIHAETGLQVDITAGSSPHPIDITLPAGKFGRPKLLLREGWSKKGATISYLNALDRKDLALFALVLVVCSFFLANSALATVRARRTEIGTLRTLGWPGRAIFTVILGELLVVAAAAGLAGTGIAALLVWRFALHVPLSRVSYVLPLAITLALIAGIGPAWEATRGEPLDAVRPPVVPGRRGHARGFVRLALLNLRRLPLRTAIAAGGLALGVAALTVLIGIERGFHGALLGTLLGNAVSIQVRRPDLVAAGITIALAAFAVADVLYLNLRERAPELATLRATGWRDGHVVRLILLEGIGLGLLGSAVGLGIGLLVGTELLPVPVQPLLAGGGIAAGAGIGAALIAATLPTAQALRLQPSVVLAGE